MKHEGRCAHPVHPVDRRQAVQQVALVGVAVLALGDGRHPRLRLLEEGSEVHDPAHADRRGEALRKFGDPGHRHVAAVGPAGDPDPRGIGDTDLDDVIDARGDVADPVEALLAVVKMHEGLPETG